jgi:hypothetical protein
MENDKEILQRAFDKYKTFRLLDIELPVKDIYDVARAALYADDVQTIRDLMLNYNGFLPIEWCHLVKYAYGRKMIRLFDIRGCTGKEIYTYRDITYNYDSNTFISSGLLFGSDKDIDATIYGFLSNIEEDIDKLSESRKILLDLERRGYLKNYPIIRAILHDDPDEYGKWINFYNMAPEEYNDTILALDAKDIYYALLPNTEIETEEHIARGSILLNILKDEPETMMNIALDHIHRSNWSIDMIDLLNSLYPDILKDNDQDRKILVYKAAEKGYLHLLNRYMKFNESIQVGIIYSYSSTHHDNKEPVYRFLDTKGFRSDWLRYYVVSPIMRKALNLNKPPSDVWKKIIATIFGDKYLRDNPKYSNNILGYIVKEHRNEITSQMIQRLAKLSGKNVGDVTRMLNAY